MTASDSSQSSRSISSSEFKTRPSTSSRQGSSLSRSATVNASQSVNPTPGALPAPAARVRTDSPSSPRARIRTPPRTATTTASAGTHLRSETPSEMSSSQTVTSTTTATATEGGWRFAHLDSGGYYRNTVTPQYLIVNATATLTANSGTSNAAGGDANVANATSSGSASGLHGSMQDRRAYTYPQSYSQIGISTSYADRASQRQIMQDRTATGSHLHSQSSWSTTIAETPVNPDSDAPGSHGTGTESNLRSSQSTYGDRPAPAELPATSAGFVQNKQFPAEYGHVRIFPELSGPESQDSSVYRPPSLSTYALTPAAAQASGYAQPAPSSHSAVWRPGSLREFETDGHGANAQWGTPGSTTSATDTSHLVAQSSKAIPESSPTHTGSPGSSTGPVQPPWLRGAPHSVAGSDESVYSRPTRSHAIKVPQRPSLARSTLFSSLEPSSSLHLGSFGTSGASSTSEPAPTSDSTALASPSRVPEPANSFSGSQYGAQSPVTPLRISGNLPPSLAGTLSPSSVAGRHDQEHITPPYESEAHSPTSSRFARSDASPEYDHVQYYEPTTALQPPFQQSGPSMYSATASGIETGTSPGSGSDATGPSNTGRMSYTFAGPSFARASASSTQSTVPATITAARPYDYSYFSSSSTSAPISTPASATASRSAMGSSSTSQSTRKRNHHCLMCDKSFDRPSTLRKHLLVHTGEKAYVCEICGRRFGVASNLNRHFRRCITRPVNSAAFRSASSTSAPASVAGSSSSAALPSTSQGNTMAREQTNPDVRRAERQRDGREAPEDEQAQALVVPLAPSAIDSSARTPRGRRRGRSPEQSPLGVNVSAMSEADTSLSQTSYQLQSTINSAGGSGQASGQLAVATASTSTGVGESGTERRPKRRRRAPSPSRWVPASLRNFSLSPVRTRTSTPLPPVSPGYDAATGAYEERDSYANVTDENVDPLVENNEAARARAERLRNFEYAPYHPCGWTGRLPGPAIVGNDVTNFTKGAGGGGSGLGGRYSGGNSGGGLHFMFEFSLAAEG